MSRIYYNEEKLSGIPIENNTINIQTFDYILNKTSNDKFELQSVSDNFWGNLFNKKIKAFKIARISNDGIHYDNTRHGHFYLPQAIIFCDNEDYNFPTVFYFIAKIGSQLELRKCNAGKGIEWFQIPTLHEPVNDKETLARIILSFTELNQLATALNNKEKEKKELDESEKMEKNRPLLGSEQRNAYRILAELCMGNNPNKQIVIEFMENVRNHDEDSNYFSTLDYIMRYLNENKCNFIMQLDWKSGVEDLEWILSKTLKENYNLSIALPNSADYGEDAIVSGEDVFSDYDTPLRDYGLQLGFIDTESDQYMVLLHKIEDKERVKDAISKTGYKYY